MIAYRQAQLRDAEAVSLLHARSWRENYRGAFTDAFLDGDLPGERLRVWHERLGAPPSNQFVQLAVDGENLGGFVCAYGGHDPRWGSFIDNIHVVSCVEAQRDRVLSHEAGRSVARPSLPRPWDLSLGVGGELLRETFLRASRRPRRRRIYHGNPRRSHRAQLSLHLARCGVAVCCLTSR